MTTSGRHRRYLRRRIQVEFRVRNADDVMGGELSFDSLDISEGGAFLQSELLLEVGDRIDVTFTLPGQSEALHLGATVAWTTQKSDRKGHPGMGLEFIALTPDERDALLAFITSH